MTGATLALEGVTRRFGDRSALDGVDLLAGPGELVTVVGPSGSGKSTLLRVVAGLDRPDSGRVLLDGADLTAVAAHRRPVAMVFQDYALYPHLTARQNLEFGLRVRREPRARRAEQVAAAAARTGVSDLLDRYPDSMSGGERQRVALARALVRDPRVHLLDEPMASLDTQLRASTRAELLGLQRRLGTTTLLVTHDQTEAMTLGDTVVVLHAGRVRQAGPPQQVYDEPADLVVAAFLGDPAMNLVDGGGALGGRPGEVVGVRPEDLHLDGAGSVEAVVDVVEALGSEAVVHVHSADGTRLAVRTPPRPGLSGGDRVRLAADPRRTHRFARSDGRRLP